MRLIAIILLLVVLVAAIVGPSALFTISEIQVAVVTRFGEPIRDLKEPGLYVKTPFVDKVIYLEKRLLLFDAPPDSLLTKDKKRLVIDVYARGRITDPRLFVETLRNESRARSRAIDIVASELRREIGLDDQSEIIRTNRSDIMARVKLAVATGKEDSEGLEGFGIEVVDVRMKRTDFPGEIAGSVYERMKAERKRIADRERAAGAKADLEKRASVDRTAVEIISAAQRDADIIRGCGEAESIAVFANALQQDPEFYTFQRSLETYRAHMVENTTIIGSAKDLGQAFEDIRVAMVDSARTPDSVSGADTLDLLESRCLQIDAESAARELLAAEIDIEERALLLESTEKVDWPDTSLGCPQEGQLYAQVIISGYRMFFSFEGEFYQVHTDQGGTQVLRCEAP